MEYLIILNQDLIDFQNTAKDQKILGFREFVKLTMGFVFVVVRAFARKEITIFAILDPYTFRKKMKINYTRGF